MLQTLTAHLLQNKELHIPFIGFFRVQQHAAALHFADRLIHPPYAEILFDPQYDGNKKEAGNLAATSITKDELESFGRKIKNSLASGKFEWSGVGVLGLENEHVIFQPESKLTLQPVPANKVLRENRGHALLVGDQERSSADTSFLNETNTKKRTWFWVWWFLLFVAMLAIGWHLYKEKSFGSKVKAVTAGSLITPQQSLYS